MEPRTSRFCLLLIVVTLFGAGCGSENGNDRIGQAEPALPPSGPHARTLSYTCAGSSNNTILVELPSSDQLADLVNGIDLCEFDGGLVEIRVEVPCSQGLRTLTVPVKENTVTNQSVRDACEVVP